MDGLFAEVLPLVWGWGVVRSVECDGARAVLERAMLTHGAREFTILSDIPTGLGNRAVAVVFVGVLS